MKVLKPVNYQVQEGMEDMTCSTLDSDCVMDILEAFLFQSSLSSNENPAEEGFDQIFGVDPLQPPTEGDMPHGAAPFGLQELVLPAPGFNVAPIDSPPLPPLSAYYAAAEEGSDPQQPPTGGDMPHGAAPFGLQELVLPAPGFNVAPIDSPPLPPLSAYYAAAEEGSDPQQPPTGGDMPHGAAPFGLQQPVLHAPGFPAGPMDFPPIPPYYAAAEEGFHPQQPHTGGAIPYGAAPFGLQQPVLPAPGPGPDPPGHQPLTALEPSYMQPAAPCRRGQVESEPWTLPWSREMNLTPLGFINGQIVYGLPIDSAPTVASDVPVLTAHTPRKSKFCREPVHERKPYIKKPPNAFMIFRTEQRVTVVAELQKQDCAAINKVIGQRWKSLPKEEQAKYYGYADKERQRHAQLFPEWSARDNYGIKRKRIRRKGPMMENPAI